MWERTEILLCILTLIAILKCDNCCYTHHFKHRRVSDAVRPRNVVLFLAEMPTAIGEGVDEPPQYVEFRTRIGVQTEAPCSGVSKDSSTACDGIQRSGVSELISWARGVRGKLTRTVTTTWGDAGVTDSLLSMRVNPPWMRIKPLTVSDGQVTTEISEEAKIGTPEAGEVRVLPRERASEVNIENRLPEHTEQREGVTSEKQVSSGSYGMNGISSSQTAVHSEGNNLLEGLGTDVETEPLHKRVNVTVVAVNASGETSKMALNEPTLTVGKNTNRPPAMNGEKIITPDTVTVGKDANDKDLRSGTANDHEDLLEVSKTTVHPDANVTEDEKIRIPVDINIPKSSFVSESLTPHTKRTKRIADYDDITYNADENLDATTPMISPTTSTDVFAMFNFSNIIDQLPSYLHPWFGLKTMDPVQDRSELALLVTDTVRGLTSTNGFLLVVWGGELWTGNRQSEMARALSEAVAEVRDDARTLVVVTAKYPQSHAEYVPLYATGPGSDVLGLTRHLLDVHWMTQLAMVRGEMAE